MEGGESVGSQCGFHEGVIEREEWQAVDYCCIGDQDGGRAQLRKGGKLKCQCVWFFLVDTQLQWEDIIHRR